MIGVTTDLVRNEIHLARAFDGMSVADLYTALAIKIHDQHDKMTEEAALRSAADADTDAALKTLGFDDIATFDRSVPLGIFGHDQFVEFLKDYGGRLEERVCGQYAAYVSGKDVSSKTNLIALVASALGGMALAPPWGSVVGIVTLLLVETGLDVVCKIDDAPAPYEV